ncbi:hypothetical protein LOK49_LG04G02401 [Camellia lanceoleosa]|uniref:Uncharacterized protein n=1 Tax=Camellia lanceoleosa TaxID=1840588 RepID=A0ACC0I3P2_9ERIC|nr:hypothetical protein LOK49_LG04G02401 [Camellia lanceoleosa]
MVVVHHHSPLSRCQKNVTTVAPPSQSSTVESSSYTSPIIDISLPHWPQICSDLPPSPQICSHLLRYPPLFNRFFTTLIRNLFFIGSSSVAAIYMLGH